MKLQALDPLLYPQYEDMLHKKSSFVDHFYHLLRDSVEPPFAVSIDGLWGTGKTTVMKMLQSKMRENWYPTFWFNPWEYRKTENVVLAFLQCLAVEYEDTLQSMKKSSGKILRTLLEVGIEAGFKMIMKGTLLNDISVKDVKEALTTAEGKQLPSFKKYQNTVEVVKKEFVELIQSISDQHENKPVIIFFDDLDRCLPGDTIELLEALKNLFVTPECNGIFICGIDTHVAKQFIIEHYHDIDETFAINYFRKIFNATISMPYSPDIYTLLFEKIKELYEWHDAEQDKAKALAEMICKRGLKTQLYSIRKYLNIIHNLYIFLKFNPDYKKATFNPENDFIVNLLIVKETWQPLYEHLIQETLRVRRYNMEELTQSIIEYYHSADKKLLPEQEEFLVKYLGKESLFKQERLAEWLADYPTLA